ncbi:MAG: HD domain-containing protein [Gammaproteobacteria bacterium]|nr:HD domain-containing protein [Gammaproteobacteria bacterium]MCW8910982.1 HD domain-containing protein [Gammaproteobacteria bacterium]MCW9005001.1 HD domain-containing protein [Gammaproteobacteria bacterium]MCW9055589.1 HD domain-containing protein [Gammaproteobacteria bacterium]
MTKVESTIQVDTVDADTLSGFFERFNVANQQIEESLLMLDLDPHDGQMLKKLAEALISIKQSLLEIEFNELAFLAQSIGNLISSIQSTNSKFESTFGDIILLAVDDIKTVIEKIIDNSEPCILLPRLPRVCEAINKISLEDKLHLNESIRDALLLLDPSIEILETAITEKSSLSSLFDDTPPDEEELAAYGVEENEDFLFFRGLSEPLENRAHYWHGRSERMLRLALKMNDHADRPVDPNQLAAAIYMHDVGMALLPIEIIMKEGPLTNEELAQVREHPRIGFELLRYMKQWSVAALIVLHHHERVDGTGYPSGLKENDICEGAKILAVVDMIDARMHERAHVTMLKRPLLRAAMEISKHADSQFSAFWVDVFRDLFHKMRKQENSEKD